MCTPQQALLADPAREPAVAAMGTHEDRGRKVRRSLPEAIMHSYVSPGIQGTPDYCKSMRFSEFPESPYISPLLLWRHLA